MKHSTKIGRKQSRRKMQKQRKTRSRKQKGGTTFTTEQKDNLIKDGGFTIDQLDYLASLPENFRSIFGSVDQSDYDFIKKWQTSVSDLYDIPPTPENMKELANKTIEDFKYFFERRAVQEAAPLEEPNQDDSITFNNASEDMDANISSVSFGGKKKRRTRRRS